MTSSLKSVEDIRRRRGEWQKKAADALNHAMYARSPQDTIATIGLISECLPRIQELNWMLGEEEG